MLIRRVIVLTVMAGAAIQASGVGALRAGINAWTSLGPDGGEVRTLVIDPQNTSTLYATGSGPLFKSTDGGAHWKTTVVSNSSLSVLAIDPQTTSTLYAGTSGGGVFKSTDGGSAWEAVNSGLPDRSYVSSLVIDPRSPSTLYALFIRNYPLGGSLVKSTGGGKSWSPAGSGLPLGGSPCCFSLAIDPQNPSTLYLGSGYLDYVGKGLYKSTDGGMNWTRTPAPEGVVLLDVVVDPQNSSTLYANGYEVVRDALNLLKSTDGGASWSPASSGLPGDIVTILAFEPQKASTLYAVTPGGVVFKSTDGGASWVDSGLPFAHVNSLAFDRRNTSTVYAGTRNGVFKSTDAGASWRPVNSGLAATSVVSLAIDPQFPSTIYAGTYFEGGSLAKSTDAGASWSSAGSGLPADEWVVAAIDPRNTGTLYALGDGGLFKSTDGGVSWVRLPFPTRLTRWGEAGAFAIDPQNPRTLYCAGAGFGWVFKSTNGGASWDRVNTADPYRLSPAEIYALAIDPQDPRTIYALAHYGAFPIFKSTDGGMSFSPARSGLPDQCHVFSLAIDPQQPATLYASVIVPFFGPPAPGELNYRNLFRSTDGGGVWEAVNPAGLPNEDVDLTNLLTDPQDSSTMYASVTGRGVFRSTDAGANWSAVNSGLTTLAVTTLAIDPANTSRVYAGTGGGGVFVITFRPQSLDVIFDPNTVKLGGSFTARFFGADLTGDTYFDIQFRRPGGSIDEVALDWQKGTSALHSVASGLELGIWTVTGVRRHQDVTDHSGDFFPVSATLTVTPF